MGSLCSKAMNRYTEALFCSIAAAGVSWSRSGLLKEPPPKVAAKVALLKYDLVEVRLNKV